MYPTPHLGGGATFQTDKPIYLYEILVCIYEMHCAMQYSYITHLTHTLVVVYAPTDKPVYLDWSLCEYTKCIVLEYILTCNKAVWLCSWTHSYESLFCIYEMYFFATHCPYVQYGWFAVLLLSTKRMAVVDDVVGFMLHLDRPHPPTTSVGLSHIHTYTHTPHWRWSLSRLSNPYICMNPCEYVNEMYCAVQYPSI
jgi:hypothetical protein